MSKFIIKAQYVALQEENKRRRDECIQLRAILAQQSQSLRSLGLANVKNDVERFHDEGELFEAFQAQKLVNRQLESELSALTEENNAKLKELSKSIDELRNERNKLHDIIHEKMKIKDQDVTIDSLKQNDLYLRYELEKSITSYADLQEQLNKLSRKIDELLKKNNILSNRLRENGLDDSIILKENVENFATVIKKAQVYQGNY